ncbi:MAG: T9SS type A sorting domain-containing protein [Chitinophagaceae bacterium]|nr:T9SS type A sorting domain-containing protein [Chitinophagaceae bacterium]
MILGSSFATENNPLAINTGFKFAESAAKVTRFYPNPATTVINFEFDKTVDKSYTLLICNFLGKRMTETRITESKITVSLDDQYFRGLYIYQLRDQSNRIVESGRFQVVK